jgi:flagellin
MLAVNGISGLSGSGNIGLNKASREFGKSAARLASGFKLSTDDVAGLSIANTMSAEIRGLQQGQRNVQDGQSMLGVAGGALGSTTESLQRMRELAVQASNGTLNNNDRSALQAEVSQLRDGIDQTAAGTTFNGINLLDGSSTSVAIETGDGSAPIDVSSALPDASSAALGIAGTDISTQAGAQAAIDEIDNALAAVGDAQANLGAQSNRLESTAENLSVRQQNVTASRSRLNETNFASETAKFKMLATQLEMGAAVQRTLMDTSRLSLSLIAG